MLEKNLYASDLAGFYWYEMQREPDFNKQVIAGVLYYLWKDLAPKLYRQGNTR